MAGIQLAFGMRTSSGVKTVHLLGSWDNYSGQLPLAKDKTSSKSGVWKGTFRFQGATLEPGQRYWYYYIIDGYHVSHDPAQSHTVEPTTGRKLNIIDIPASSSSSSSSSRSKSSTDKHSKHSSHDKHSSHRREARRDSLALSLEIPKGRPLSMSKIKAPKPISPGAAKFIKKHDYESQTVEELTKRFANTSYYDDYSPVSSPPSSAGSSLSSRSGSVTSMSDDSSVGVANCVCERYGITRKGDRIKLDCGGSRCGYVDDSSSCCSDDDYEYEMRSSRRGDVRVRR